MNKITVKTLLKSLSELDEKGYGNHKILLSNDDEGNGYHECFYVASEIPEKDLEYIKDTSSSTTEEITPNKYIILG